MKRVLFCFLMVIGVAGAAVVVPPQPAPLKSGLPLEASSGALVAAYDALDRARLAQNQDVVVIARRRGFLVVSFLVSDKDVSGGSVHVVYNSDLGKVVHVMAEE